MSNVQMKQVVIINITRMGDLVQMGALLSRLQEEWPGVAVDLIVDRRFAPIAGLLKGLRDVLAFDFHALIDESRAAVKDVTALYRDVAAWAKPLLERRYDRVINLTFNQPSALLSGYIGASDIRGARSAWDGGMVVDNPWMAYFCDFHQFRRFNRFNLVDVYALGGSGPGAFSPLQLSIAEEARAWARQALHEAPDWIAVQAGASDSMKAWRPHLFGLTLARLSKQWHGGIAFIGSTEEEAAIAEVTQVYKNAGGQNQIKNMAGRTTVSQLAGLLAECRVLVTNDTGPMHVSVAAGTPVIDLSVGHVDFQETGPYGPGHWVVQPDLECAPCGFEQICAHHACKDRILPDFVGDLLLHVLKNAPCASRESGVRLYQSGVDEDGLGTFRLQMGTEPLATAWYARFWRRYWYESHTGICSNVPAPEEPPPDATEAQELIQRLRPLLTAACRRADDIARLAARVPVNVSELKRLQCEQRAEQDRLFLLGMSTAATAPVTAAFVRQLHNDNVEGVGRLARHQASAYRAWLTRVTEIDRLLIRSIDGHSSLQPDLRQNIVPVGVEPRVA
ncbi:MAG: glycosyltransferase family 9 protein [Nitrospira sp. CG24B]|nr:MAG: glycosyltransferase family 9 protein [Nitrospira sp. CG24B]